MATPTVTLAAIIKQLNLNINYVPDDPEKLIIHKKDVTRPGLPLAGFYDIFDAERIQVVGLTEDAYIESLDADKKREHLEAFFSKHHRIALHKQHLKMLPFQLIRLQHLVCG